MKDVQIAKKLFLTITMLLCVVGFSGCDNGGGNPPQPPPIDTTQLPSDYELQPCENTTEYLYDIQMKNIITKDDSIYNSTSNLHINRNNNNNVYHIDFNLIDNGKEHAMITILNRLSREEVDGMIGYKDSVWYLMHYKICNFPDDFKEKIKSLDTNTAICITGKVYKGNWSLHHPDVPIPQHRYYNLELTSIRWGGDDE